MKRQMVTALLYTAITAILLGLVYPMTMTGLAKVLFPRQAAGSLIERNGEVVGSALIGQAFTGPGYFHSRPSMAGTGYDAGASGGSNLSSTSQSLVESIATREAASTKVEGTGPVPVDLVTASASGLDPDISPAAALYQTARVAAARKIASSTVEALVRDHVTPRQFGLLGEPRVNVLALNMALDGLSSK